MTALERNVVMLRQKNNELERRVSEMEKIVESLISRRNGTKGKGRGDEPQAR